MGMFTFFTRMPENTRRMLEFATVSMAALVAGEDSPKPELEKAFNPVVSPGEVVDKKTMGLVDPAIMEDRHQNDYIHLINKLASPAAESKGLFSGVTLVEGPAAEPARKNFVQEEQRREAAAVTRTDTSLAV